MKKIGEINISKLAKYQDLAVLEGHNVYLSAGFCDADGKPRDDSPIIIDKGGGDGIALNADDINNWKEEAIEYIRQNLDRIDDPICRYVSPCDIPQEQQKSFIIELSRNIYDRTGNIVARIIAYNKKPSDEILEKLEDEDLAIPTIEVEVHNCIDEHHLDGVMDQILNTLSTTKYKDSIMWHLITAEDDYSKELGFQLTEAGISLRQIV